jgi:hypothetical protein
LIGNLDTKIRESVEPAKIPEDVTATIWATVERSMLYSVKEKEK